MLTGTVLIPAVSVCAGAWAITWKTSGSLVLRKILKT